MSKRGTYFGISEDGSVVAAASFGGIYGSENEARKLVIKGGNLPRRLVVDEDSEEIFEAMVESMVNGTTLDKKYVFAR